MAAVLPIGIKKSPWSGTSGASEDKREDDIIISDLTDSVDDLGKLLSSTANVEVYQPAQNRFPLVVEEPRVPSKVVPTDDEEEYDPVGKEEEGVVYYSSRASTSSSEDSSGVESVVGTPTSQSTDEFIWNSSSPTNTPDTNNTVAVLREKRSTPIIDDRRWSSISTRPGDAANCDCTSLAFATLRGSKSKKRIRALREAEESYQKVPPDSPDSGVDSASSHSSSDSGLSPAKIATPKSSKHSKATLLLPKSPQKSSSLGPGQRKSPIAVFLDSFMYKMFRVQRSKSASAAASGGNNNSKNIKNLAVTIPDAKDLAEKEKLKNGVQSYSPRWRDDPTDEASPLSRPFTAPSTTINNNNYSTTPRNGTAVSSPSGPLTPKTSENRSGTPIISISPFSKAAPFDNIEAHVSPIADTVYKTIPTTQSHASIDLKTTQPLTTASFSAPKKLPPATPSYHKIAGKLAHVPRFHFPAGKPLTKTENDFTLSKIEAIFTARPQGLLRPRDFDEVSRKMGFPVYTKRAVYEAVCECSRLPASENPDVTFRQFSQYWNEMISKNHDEAARFIFTLSVAKTGLPGRPYLEKEDFYSIFYDLIETYPGLKFLNDATQFHTRYVEVVVARIYWNVNRSWTGRITANELRRSNFLETMHMLEETEEINKITDYFSYEHFYVIYCKFWELDYDHDMIISRDDMRNHCDGALTDRIIDRIFSRAVTRSCPGAKNTMQPRRGPVREEKIETIGFEEFVYFLLAEEDKRHPTSIEYWFRCLDLDGDGVISSYEMELFYNDIVEKIHAKNYETLEFVDVANQLFDLVSPESGQITLRDLKRCGLAHRFFNTFVNYIKYLEQESADGERASVKMNGDKELSDWEKFCAVEYEILMTEADEDGQNDSYDVVLDDEDLPEGLN